MVINDVAHHTNSERIAVVTPSFERDRELCGTLNRSVMEFLPASVRHYIVVDRRDLPRFKELRSDRTIVITKEEILPRGLMQLPKLNRWYSAGSVFPISGWLVQQIAKLATASVLSETTLLMVDSDAVFVRDVDTRVFARDGRTRLYLQRGAITADMASHAAWHKNGCLLLGIPVGPLPADDYIGQVISWKRDLVLRMRDRIEHVTGRRWYQAIAHARQVSEYLLYGLFVEHVAGSSGNVWMDEHPRCNSHWASSALSETNIATFIESLKPDDIAMMISAHSETTSEARAAAISLATRGRL